jgi:hypothetical protein
MPAQATDAFIDVESAENPGDNGADEWGTWEHLLSQAKNLKGAAQLHVQRFHGRDGMRSFKMLNLSTKDGVAVASSKDVAAVDAGAVAKQCWLMAVEDARREGCDKYRLQLYKWSGGVKDPSLVKGAFAGLKINPVTGEVIWNASAEQTPEAKWKEIADWCADRLQTTMGAATELTNAGATAMITAVTAGDELVQRRMDHARNFEAAALPTPPEEVTKRFDVGIKAFQGSVREAMRWYMWNKTGNMPPPGLFGDAQAGGDDPTEDNAKLQKELLALFESLDGEVHDQIAAMMGKANWDGMMAVLRGSVDDFVRNYLIMGPMLAKHLHDGRLDTVLPPDKLAKLKAILSS